MSHSKQSLRPQSCRAVSLPGSSVRSCRGSPARSECDYRHARGKSQSVREKTSARAYRCFVIFCKHFCLVAVELVQNPSDERVLSISTFPESSYDRSQNND